MTAHHTRASTAEDRAGLKTAFRLLAGSVGKLEYLAEYITRITPGCLSRAGNVADDYWPPMDAVLDLERAAPKPLVTEYMARIQGYRLVPMGDAGPVDLMREVASTMALLGVFAKHATDAQTDGILSRTERVMLVAALKDLLAQVQSVHDRLAAGMKE